MKVFYEKVGRRYKPVYQYDDDLMSAFPKGAHLVICAPGSKTMKYNVEPANAAVYAAIMMHRDSMADVLRKASEARPTNRPLTKLEQKALAAWYAVAGPESMMTLDIPSAYDMIDAMQIALLGTITKGQP